MKGAQPLQARQTSDVPEKADFQEGDVCEYCGAPLNRLYYFCLRCASPYRQPDNLLRPLKRKLTEGELIDHQVPQVKTLFWAVFTTVLACGVFSAVAFHENNYGLALIFSEVVLTCVVGFFAVRYRNHLGWQFKRVGLGHPVAWAGLGLLAVCLAINYGYGTLLESLLSEDQVSPSPWAMVREEGYSEGTLIVLACLAPAVVEEIAFRGLLQNWMAMAISPGRALLISAALFSGVHFSVLSFPYLLLVGLLLGWTWWKTRSLYPPMLLHFLHNYVVIEFF
jgi:membrane protease YdiL (CAAX protease family)